MVLCFVPQCMHRTAQSNCSFTRFPKEEVNKKKWIKAIRREDRNPGLDSRICSCHFINGNTSGIPSLFEWNQKKIFQFQSPEKKKRKRRAPRSEIQEVLPSINGGPSTSVSLEDTADIFINVENQIPRENVQPQDELLITDVDDCHIIPGRLGIHSETNSGSVNTELCQDSESRILPPVIATSTTPTSVMTQTDHEFSSQFYEAEKYFMQKEIDSLKAENSKLLKQNFGFFTVSQNDDLCSHYTGISLQSFKVVSQLTCNYSTHKTILSHEDKLFLTLIKFRRNLSVTDLGVRFGISIASVSSIVGSYVTILHDILYTCLLDVIPSQKKNQMYLPGCFQSFQNCRMIIDCTEIECAIPSNMRKQRLTYSSYKSRNTFKALVGIAPNGCFTYCSELYPGGTSDKEIVKHSGVLKHMMPGDLILADKGFTITDLLPSGVSLNIPPFHLTPHFTLSEIYETTRIAQARIHIERAIRRLKGYLILKYVPSTLFSRSTEIIQVCASLVNFQYPIMKETEKLYTSCMEELANEDE